MIPKDAFSEITSIQKEIILLKNISSLLEWDKSTHMPQYAVGGRADQIAFVEKLIHNRYTSKKSENAVKILKKSKLNKEKSLIAKEFIQEYQKHNLIPNELFMKIVQAQVLGQKGWENAREKNDFRLFKPFLKKIMSLKREYTKFCNPLKKPYENILDMYEPGITIAELDIMIENLKKEIVPIIAKNNNKRKTLNVAYRKKDDPHSLINEYIDILGIPKTRFTIDISVHPFSTLISKNDVRITTSNTNPIDLFFTLAHESGHALYDLGLPKRYYNTLLFKAPSYGLHESQSLLWEFFICKNRSFWEGYWPKFKNHVININFEEMINWVNHPNPTLIRMNASELYYPLHIVMRYEIEKGIFDGSISIDQLKDIWNKKTKELFGIEPKDDNEGILQDEHWATGSFGYFPSYLLGLIYSAQLYYKIKKDIPNFEILIKELNFGEIIGWLRRKIHQKGNSKTAKGVIKSATGEDANPKYLIEHLKNKFIEKKSV